MKLIYNLTFLFFTFFCSHILYAQEIVDSTIELSVKSSNLSIDAQEKIEKLDEISKKLYFDYKDTLNEYKALKSYDDQLSEIIDAQFAEIENINSQIDSLDDINIDILPLLKTMTDTLRKVINLDIPFLKEDRLERVDITTAEKFRKVFEAYQIEANFGKTIETYPGYIVLDNAEVAVDFFRLGRLGFYYRTPNGKETGYWDINENNWSHEGGSLDADIKVALDISNRQSPPNFITLPLKPVEK